MLKIGMVGMGGISRSHTAAWAQIPEAQVVCVCDIRPEKAEEAAKVTGGKPYTSFDEMLEKESFDVLDICLPTYLHPEFAIRGLNSGKHVLTEKPISLKREDVARVYAAAEKNGKNFMVAQCVRFWREYVALKDAFDSGKYGRLLSGHMERLGNTPQWSWDNWMRDPERSGLVPFDLHIHDLDYMIYTFGKPQNVVVHRAKEPNQDYFNVIYEYPGFFISAEAAWFEGAYAFHSSFRFQFEKAVMEYRDGKLTIYLQNGEKETLEDEQGNENGINLPKTNAYFNEIRYFVDCIQAGKPCDKVQPEELETVLEIIDKINA
ncbi:MAG: Gfo/Idh/MocA family oxidoreductase [Clostridia bacterium]|nr:Gfo/Idh/MocA family oxidoreductase [Clostridia bacterium]